jgi:hypothetical protein
MRTCRASFAEQAAAAVGTRAYAGRTGPPRTAGVDEPAHARNNIPFRLKSAATASFANGIATS